MLREKMLGELWSEERGVMPKLGDVDVSKKMV